MNKTATVRIMGKDDMMKVVCESNHFAKEWVGIMCFAGFNHFQNAQCDNVPRWFSGTLTNCTLWRRPVSFSKAINDWTECPSVKHERSLVEFVVQFEVGGFLMYYVLFSNIWSWYPYRKDAICVFCSGWNLSPVFKCYAHRVGEQVSGVFWSNHSVGCRQWQCTGQRVNPRKQNQPNKSPKNVLHFWNAYTRIWKRNSSGEHGPKKAVFEMAVSNLCRPAITSLLRDLSGIWIIKKLMYMIWFQEFGL